MKSLRSIYEEIKTRKIRKWLAIHTSSVLTLLGVINLFSSRYKFPEFLFDIITLVGVAGIPSVILIAWNHAKEGVQKISKSEFIFHSAIFIFILVFSVKIIKNTASIKIEFKPKSVAILPFKNLSQVKEDDYFAAGIMEDLLTQLSKISQLNVVSRTSVMKYEKTNKNIKEIGKELGVENILEGSVRRAGNMVRIVSQLIDVNKDRHIWAETYDREMKDIFKIQSEIAQQIAFRLEAKLSDNEKVRINKEATKNLEAYGFYLRGREYYNAYKKDDNEKAIELFKKAIELDKNYALAYSGIADAYAQRSQRYGYNENWIDSAIVISKKAIGLDPDIAEPYKALGLAYALKGWFNKARIEYYNALKINPNMAPAITNIGGLNMWLGNYPEAYKWHRKGIAVSPGKASASRAFGYLYACLINDDLSEKWYNKTLELQPDYNYAISELSKLYIMQGVLTKARNLLKKYENEDDRLFSSAIADLELFSGNYSVANEKFGNAIKFSSLDEGGGTEYAFTFIKLGKQKEASEILDSVQAINLKYFAQGSENYDYMYELARIYSILDEKEEAYRWLQKAIDSGWLMYRWMEKDPLLENIKGSPTFKKMMDSVKEKIDKMRNQVREIENQEKH